MASTPEGRVKRQVVAELERIKAAGTPLWWFFPVAGVYGKSGIPDIIVCWNGRFVGIECKAGRNPITRMQQVIHDYIRQAEGYVYTAREGEDHLPLLSLIDSVCK